MSSMENSNMLDEVTVYAEGKSTLDSKPAELKSEKEELALAQQSEEVKQKAKLEEAELKGNIIDVTKVVENYSKNSDGSIDKNKVSTFGLNMGKLGFYSYESFSKALNLQLIEDKKIIQDQNKGIKEKEIDKTLKQSYTQKIEVMMNGSIPEGSQVNTFFGSSSQSYNKLTGAYLEGTYKTDTPKTTAFEVKNDKDMGIDKETNDSTEELSANEMKKISKETIKFLNSESLSPAEKKQIRLFAKTVANIQNNNTENKAIEKQILEYFAGNPNSLSFTKENRMEKDKIPGLVITESDAKRLQKLNQLYYEAMNGDNQTLRRLFFIIQQEKSIGQVKNSFDGSIAKEKENKKYIKQQSNKFEAETFVTGEKLGYKKENLAKAKAYITTIDTEKRQDTKAIINAITDFDFNGFLNHKDAGTKTGLQIQKIISAFGEEKSLENILALTNKVGEKMGIEKVTKENILSSLESPAYLLLVQNTLKNPSFDVSDIVRYGDKAIENIYNLSDASAETISTQTNKIINEAKTLGIPVESGLKDIVSTSIVKAYSEYGYGLGIPFDSFIKGLSLNLGMAHFPNGAEDFGINIGRNGKKSIGKGREVIGGASTGTTLVFVPMASGQIGLEKTFDNKKQSTSLDIRTSKKFQLSGHAIVMPGYAGYGASAGVDRSKRNSALEQAPKLQGQLKTFFAKLLEPKEGEKTFKFNKEEISRKLQTELETSFKNSKKDTITKAVNNMSLVLAAYDGLPKEKIGEASTKIAESYANARVNQSANDIDNKRYLGGAGLSVTFFEGIIPVVGVLTFKKNKITSYNDKNPELIKSAEFAGVNNEKFKGSVEDFTKEVNQHTGTAIKTEGNYLVIPKSDKLEVRINSEMKGLVKTNANGDLLVHKDSPVRFAEIYASDRGRKVLNIGSETSSDKDIVLDKTSSEIPKDFVTDKEVSIDDLPTTETPNTENVNKILEELRNKSKEDTKALNDVKAEVVEGAIIFKNLDKEIGKIEKSSTKTLITIKEKSDGSLDISSKEDSKLKKLKIEFITNAESKEKEATTETVIDDTETNKIIGTIYNEGREITDNLFHNIIHKDAGKKLAADYDGFNKNMKEHNYISAKGNLTSMLANINQYTKNNLGKESFKETRVNLEKTNDEYQLNKILSAFNVLLSRTANVKLDKKGNYTYRYGGEQINNGKMIIEESEKRVLEGGKNYPGGFLKQMESLRPKTEGQSSLNKDNVKKLFEGLKSARKEKNFNRKPTQTENTIGFNHGNPQDFFKLQMNPEIIDSFRIGLNDLKDLDQNFKDDLRSAYINQLIETEPDLIKNILTKAGLDKLDTAKIKELFNGKSLDIDNKKYTLDYSPSFGYNPECNNLMRLLENIKIKTIDKTKLEKKYESSLVGNPIKINYTETDSQVNMQEKRFSIAGGKAFKKGGPETKPGETEVPGTTPGETPVDIPKTTPGEIPSGNPNTTPPANTGGTGNSGSQGGGRE